MPLRSSRKITRNRVRNFVNRSSYEEDMDERSLAEKPEVDQKALAHFTIALVQKCTSAPAKCAQTDTARNSGVYYDDVSPSEWPDDVYLSWVVLMVS